MYLLIAAVLQGGTAEHVCVGRDSALDASAMHILLSQPTDGLCCFTAV
jgi:hypothetical protein